MLPDCFTTKSHHHILFFQNDCCSGCVCITHSCGPLIASSIARLAVTLAATRCIFFAAQENMTSNQTKEEITAHLKEALEHVGVPLCIDIKPFDGTTVPTHSPKR